jgi:DNA-binding FadR family transcriptional regulator
MLLRSFNERYVKSMNAVDDNSAYDRSESIERRGLVDQVISVLRSDISSGRYTVGQRLPSELELSKKLKVGRSTIREAIKSLNLVGLVDTVNGRGSFVASHNLSLPRQKSVGSLGRISELIEVVEFRCMIEVEAAYWASQRAGAEQIEQIRTVWRAFNQAVTNDKENVKDCIRLDIDFHTAVVHAARNQLMLKAYENAREAIEWAADIVFYAGPIERMKDVHQGLVQGLEQRNPAAAVKAVRQNFEELNSYIRVLIAQQP